MLKIIPATEVILVECINLVLYGPPGAGKTTTGFTAERPLLLDFDKGAHRAANRKDSVRIGDWKEVENITRADLEPYATVVVDTAGRALDTLTADIIRGDPKLGRGGSLTLQGYGALKARFIAWLKLINSFGLDVVLIAHMDEQRNGDEVVERLDVQGGSKGEIYKAADAMGRVKVTATGRELNFNPTDAAFGKNPGQLPAMVIPHPDREPQFLAGVIEQIKAKLNAMTEEQIEAQAVLEKWRLSLNDIEDVDGINRMIPDATSAGPVIKALLHDRALALGLVPDPKKKCYVQKSAKAA